MCLITKQKEAFIAEEDIIVYKVLSDGACSIFERFEYELGEIYTEQIKESSRWDCLGILDSVWLNKEYPHHTWQGHRDLICLGKGFHSIDKLKSAKEVLKGSRDDSKIFKCTIPKGSKYFKNQVGFMVSSSIIINKKMSYTREKLMDQWMKKLTKATIEKM